MLASRRIKREKASLPVDVRRSKTSLLKLPIQKIIIVSHVNKVIIVVVVVVAARVKH